MVKIDTRNLGVFNEEDFSKTLLYQSTRTRVLLLCLEPGQGLPEHLCKFEVVWYVLEGCGTFVMDGEAIDCAADSLIVTPACTKRGLKAISRMRVLATIPRLQGISITASLN